MNIFEIKLHYCDGDLQDGTRTFNATLALCLSSTRYFFDLPTKEVMRRANKEYYLSVHDRKRMNGLQLRMHNRKVQMFNENTGKWVSRAMYWETENKLDRLFNTSGKKYLYVVIEEA